MITSTLFEGVFLEVLISIPMSLCILLPLARFISKKNFKTIFWILFVIRAIILLYFDYRGVYRIYLVDLAAVCVAAFFLILKSEFESKKDTKDNNISNGNIPENNNIDSNTLSDGMSGNYVDTDRYLNSIDDGFNTKRSTESKVIQKCDVCGRKSELSFSYCPYCGAFLLGDIVSDEENK